MIKYTQNKIYLPFYLLTENNTSIVKLCRKQVLLACFIFQLVFLNLHNKTNRPYETKKYNIKGWKN